MNAVNTLRVPYELTENSVAFEELLDILRQHPGMTSTLSLFLMRTHSPLTLECAAEDFACGTGGFITSWLKQLAPQLNHR